MNVNLKAITTESRNPNTMDIDLLSTKEIIEKINHEDKTIAFQVEKAIPQIARVVDMVVESFEKEGRLIYMGAGTSGRIGILDAVECPPTFGVHHDMVICLMAGGMKAMTVAVEGAEDSKEMAINDLKAINANANDIVIGIAASGRTPYVLGGVEYAKRIGIKTACITTSVNSILAQTVDYPIEAITGPEPITGSTRMKSGTAQKMICNMITTTSMIKLGKVYENLMIDVQATNLKLVSRSLKIITDITNYNELEASKALKKYQTIKRVIFNYLTGIDDLALIENFLNESNGHLRKAVNKALRKE